MMSQDVFVQAFREAAPYIHYLRGKTLVVGVASDLLNARDLSDWVADLNLLAVLGIRLVLVHGSETQISQFCQQNDYPIRFHQHRRVCDAAVLNWAKAVCGQWQCDLQAALSVGVAKTVQRSASRLRVVNGNVLVAQPLGVINGVDMGFAGEVRKVDSAAIGDYLEQNAIVLISPLGTSLSGQYYHLTMPDVAAAVAVALKAEKLIFLTSADGITDEHQQLRHELTREQAETQLQHARQQTVSHQDAQTLILQAAVQALQHDVSRVQVLSGSLNGGLLRELFTKEGVGTSIANTPFVSIRTAQEWDIADLMALIRPLEEQGVLMRRTQAHLAEHIHEFSVLEHDRQIDGCVALKQFADAPDVAELACLVVSPQARAGGYGDLLLKHLVAQAQALGKTRLFALSTHTSDWFVERGFVPCAVRDLPAERQAEYHANGRQSRVFVMDLRL